MAATSRHSADGGGGSEGGSDADGANDGECAGLHQEGDANEGTSSRHAAISSKQAPTTTRTRGDERVNPKGAREQALTPQGAVPSPTTQTTTSNTTSSQHGDDLCTPERHLPTPGQRGHSPQRHTAAGSAAPTTRHGEQSPTARQPD